MMTSFVPTLLLAGGITKTPTDRGESGDTQLTPWDL